MSESETGDDDVTPANLDRDTGSNPESDRAAETAPTTDRSVELAATVELLEEENRRLRREYASARRSRYRHTALGLLALGLIAGIAAFAVEDGRSILLALAGVGLFGGVLTYLLAPGTYVSADVGAAVYGSLSESLGAIATELDLAEERWYLPGGPDGARLFVPSRGTTAFPRPEAGPIVVDPDTRGLVLTPSGARLLEPIETAATGGLADEPGPLSAQLADGVVEVLELARGVETDLDPANDRATFRISEPAFGRPDRLDHPVVSTLATGLARGLEAPISVAVAEDPGRADWLVTCRWRAGATGPFGTEGS